MSRNWVDWIECLGASLNRWTPDQTKILNPLSGLPAELEILLPKKDTFVADCHAQMPQLATHSIFAHLDKIRRGICFRIKCML